MTPLQKGKLVIDGDRTAGTRDRGIGGSWFHGIFRTGLSHGIIPQFRSHTQHYLENGTHCVYLGATVWDGAIEMLFNVAGNWCSGHSFRNNVKCAVEASEAMRMSFQSLREYFSLSAQ